MPDLAVGGMLNFLSSCANRGAIRVELAVDPSIYSKLLFTPGDKSKGLDSAIDIYDVKDLIRKFACDIDSKQGLRKFNLKLLEARIRLLISNPDFLPHQLNYIDQLRGVYSQAVYRKTVTKECERYLPRLLKASKDPRDFLVLAADFFYDAELGAVFVDRRRQSPYPKLDAVLSSQLRRYLALYEFSKAEVLFRQLIRIDRPVLNPSDIVDYFYRTDRLDEVLTILDSVKWLYPKESGSPDTWKTARAFAMQKIKDGKRYKPRMSKPETPAKDEVLTLSSYQKLNKRSKSG